jgi:hypothetical protein
MDEPAANVTDKAEKPQNQKNNEDSPKHKVFLLVEVSSASYAGIPVRLWIFPIRQIFSEAPYFYINSNKSLATRTEKHYKHSAFVILQTLLSMRSNLLASSLIFMLLAGSAFGCAYDGTIVEKRSRPLPDSSMTGTEGVYSFVFRGPTGTSRIPITVPNPMFWVESNGMYSFLLRDQQGNVRSQMVTAEVFARCRVGDYFNDRGPACANSDSKDSKSVTTVVRHRQHRRVAQTRRTHRNVAMHRNHAGKSRKAIALRASRAVSQG